MLVFRSFSESREECAVGQNFYSASISVFSGFRRNLAPRSVRDDVAAQTPDLIDDVDRNDVFVRGWCIDPVGPAVIVGDDERDAALFQGDARNAQKLFVKPPVI